MKKYSVMFTTGAVFTTKQDFLYNGKGYALSAEAVRDVDNDKFIPIDGNIMIGNLIRAVEDMRFQSKDIIAAWEETI